jgi:hypothetical protein
MSSKKQTAVEWLVEKTIMPIEKILAMNDSSTDSDIHQIRIDVAIGLNDLVDILNQAKAVEKQQILSAFDSGEACWYDDFSEYYTSTYGQ